MSHSIIKAQMPIMGKLATLFYFMRLKLQSFSQCFTSKNIEMTLAEKTSLESVKGCNTKLGTDNHLES